MSVYYVELKTFEERAKVEREIKDITGYEPVGVSLGKMMFRDDIMDYEDFIKIFLEISAAVEAHIIHICHRPYPGNFEKSLDIFLKPYCS